MDEGPDCPLPAYRGRTRESDAAWAMAYTVKRARASLQRALVASLRADGSPVRTAHAQVFEALTADGVRLSELAERTRMTHQAMSELVGELVGFGYLERVADPRDGRARLIRPTAEGRAQIALAAAHLGEIRRRWQDRLGAVPVDEVVAAVAELNELCDAIVAGPVAQVPYGSPT